MYKDYLVKVEELSEFVLSLNSDECDYKPDSGTWSIREVVAHLADCEAQAYCRYRSIVADADAKIMNHDEWQAWNASLANHLVPCDVALKLLSLNATANMNLLRSFSARGLSADRRS